MNRTQEFCEKLSDFNGQEITLKSKKALQNVINEMKLNGYFVKNIPGEKILRIHYGNYCSQLSEVVCVFDYNGKFHVNIDRLWKNVFAEEEREMEMKACRFN